MIKLLAKNKNIFQLHVKYRFSFLADCLPKYLIYILYSKNHSVVYLMDGSVSIYAVVRRNSV